MKDPAFLFYPGDYLKDTLCLSDKVHAAYDNVMCDHMKNICISQSRLKLLAKNLNDEEFAELISVLDEIPGGFQIEWVARSILKRKDYSESRRKNRGGKTENHINNICDSYVKHMENENENIKNIEKEECERKKEKGNQFSQDVQNLYDRVIKYFSEDLHPKTEKQKEEWIDTLDKLIRIDQKTPETISKVIEAARKDEFWKKNFLSVLKLRKKNGEQIMYFTVFEKSIGTNGRVSQSDERCPERVNHYWGR